MRCLEVTVKLASAERLAAFRYAMHDQDGIGVLAHKFGNLQKLPDERCRNRRILGIVGGQERQDLVIARGAVLVFLGIVVQRPGGNRNTQLVGGVLDHVAGAFGQLVNELLVVEVDVSLDNIHDYTHFLPVIPLGQKF